MQTRLIIFFLSCCLMAFSCDTKDAFSKAPQLLPGFTLVPSPNSLDKPGTIIAVDKKGVKQPLGSLSIPIQEGTTVPAQRSGKKNSSVGALLEFLGADQVNLTANANVNINRDVVYKIELGESALERIALLNIAAELENTKQLIKSFSATNNMADYTFYIITEAVKSKKMKYSFDTKKTGEIGLKAELDKIVTAKPNVKWDNADNFLLSFELPAPLYVYSKYFTLNVETQVTGETKFAIGKVVGTNEPVYNKTK
jgi:hypothetical protein